MQQTHIGWRPKKPAQCPKCSKPYKPTGSRSGCCLDCNPHAVNCRDCGERYLRHRAHRCKATA